MLNLSTPLTLRLGTRGSLLARTQSGQVADALRALHPSLSVELIILKTSGDRITDKPLHEFGGKGLFTKELELALLDGSIDFAVHSYKDVPVTMPLVEQSDLLVAAVPKRADPRDLLVARGTSRVLELPANARVGTGSLRRRSQLIARRPDFLIEGVRGNIDTRLRKLAEGEYDALILATAGVSRAGLLDARTMFPIDADEMISAPAQGALMLQCRRSDVRTRELLASLHDSETAACVEAERELVRLLQGDCLSPIGAFAARTTDGIRLRAAVGARGGELPVHHADATAAAPVAAAHAAFEALSRLGVMADLHRAV